MGRCHPKAQAWALAGWMTLDESLLSLAYRVHANKLTHMSLPALRIRGSSLLSEVLEGPAVDSGAPGGGADGSGSLSFPPRYRSGTRGYMKAVVLDLLRRYLRVEHHFQQGKSPPSLGDKPTGREGPEPYPSCLPLAHYDKCVINLREQLKPDMSQVLDCIFSHAQVAKKNQLVIMLIVSRKGRPILTVGVARGPQTFWKGPEYNYLSFCWSYRLSPDLVQHKQMDTAVSRCNFVVQTRPGVGCVGHGGGRSWHRLTKHLPCTEHS